MPGEGWRTLGLIAATIVVPIAWGAAVHALLTWAASRRTGRRPRDEVFTDWQI